MKREFDVKLTYEQVTIVEKALAEELEYKIFYADADDYIAEDIFEQIVLYKKFKAITDAVMAEEVCEEPTKRERDEGCNCQQEEGEWSGAKFDADNDCGVICSDECKYVDACNNHEHGVCDCCETSETPNRIVLVDAIGKDKGYNKYRMQFAFDDAIGLAEGLFNYSIPVGSVFKCDYNPNKIFPGEWAESANSEGYWKRTK